MKFHMAVFYNLKVGHLHNQKILDKWQNAYHYGIVLKKPFKEGVPT